MNGTSDPFKDKQLNKPDDQLAVGCCLFRCNSLIVLYDIRKQLLHNYKKPEGFVLPSSSESSSVFATRSSSWFVCTSAEPVWSALPLRFFLRRLDQSTNITFLYNATQVVVGVTPCKNQAWPKTEWKPNLFQGQRSCLWVLWSFLHFLNI